MTSRQVQFTTTIGQTPAGTRSDVHVHYYAAHNIIWVATFKRSLKTDQKDQRNQEESLLQPVQCRFTGSGLRSSFVCSNAHSSRLDVYVQMRNP